MPLFCHPGIQFAVQRYSGPDFRLICYGEASSFDPKFPDPLAGSGAL